MEAIHAITIVGRTEDFIDPDDETVTCPQYVVQIVGVDNPGQYVLTMNEIRAFADRLPIL